MGREIRYYVCVCVYLYISENTKYNNVSMWPHVSLLIVEISRYDPRFHSRLIAQSASGRVRSVCQSSPGAWFSSSSFNFQYPFVTFIQHLLTSSFSSSQRSCLSIYLSFNSVFREAVSTQSVVHMSFFFVLLRTGYFFPLWLCNTP